ncbi:cobalamin B12-binding domain-containing protein [Chloroflexus sp.]|uniref:cobalamin B12-binding domain-containing protein n=1 Tax=Chloroflexus sp. TaxID=1904827 RepID=UPI002ADDB5CF|nr:cobalamin B12-binding domain-containing protein [Chloroflexus sp.]
MTAKQKTVVAAALGECVHVAGVMNFLRLAEEAGWRTVFLGPATPIERVIEAARHEQADLVGVSYRLTPETGAHLLGRFAEAADELHVAGVRFAFAGTPPLAEKAVTLGFFEQVFDGSESADQVLAYLRGQRLAMATEADFPQHTIERIRWKSPYPLIRHHFGLLTMQATIDGITQIAAARCLDVISLGIDQDAQENFFRPDRQDPVRRGAGGVPVRSADDYRALYAASRRGNYPLLRTYSGTDDFVRLAELYVETINIAWCAIPLFWFNQMDGRGPWDLEGSIREHQTVMRWYGERNIPVELNEPHHWGMRDAPDTVFVASAYLSAYNARAFGVRDYIAQLMFNSPPGLSDAMDLAKMLAVLEITKPLIGPDFRIWKQTRTGLLSYPVDPVAARAHLAASIYLQMALRPHIVHVVGHTEAHHAATAEDVIEACSMARRTIENALRGQPDLTADPAVQARAAQLVEETHYLLDAIAQLAPAGVTDPLIDPATLTKAVTVGLLDAPQLRNNPFAPGRVVTRFINGMCVAVDERGRPLEEKQRIQQIMDHLSPMKTAR